ncbi:MAG: aminotransferase class I/II-fold pyridoxal phosphate-dependent enzyme, partial [bacterium]|nr:aminotransferase class I/II-fold pyridoxal phosphate-dependent enzyme [bacterium]
MSEFAKSIVDAVRSVVGPSDELVLLHRPYLPPTAWTYIKDCLDTGWVSSAGSYVTRFEQELAGFTGAKRAVATVNGTAALQVCLHLAGVEAGDEVICPSLTFVATANAIHFAGGTPHFVDVDAERLGMSPVALAERLSQVAERKGGQWINRETGRRIAAVCPMHCFGIPCNMDPLLEICNQYELPLV